MRSFSDPEIFVRLGVKTSYYQERDHKRPLIVGIQSESNPDDDFPDKFFLYDKNEKFIIKATGTTRCGQSALKTLINRRGAFIWKTDEYYSGCFEFGLHSGRMKCLRLKRSVKGYRDLNKDGVHDEVGILYTENPSANFHGVSYDLLETNTTFIKKIKRWSAACQVCNNMLEYRQIIKFVYENGGVANYALLKEWGREEDIF